MVDPSAALALGLTVFPLQGRIPVHADWSATGSCDLEEICSWPVDCNIGVGCRANGLVVLDLDQHDGCADGEAEWMQLCAAAGVQPPATVNVWTPRGRHLYFRAPQGRWFASGVARPGIDVRAPGRRSGGYVVGPGSIVGEHIYTAAGSHIAALPDWLAPLLPGKSIGSQRD